MAADVRNNISLWSSTESLNLPIGSTTVGTNLDDNLRMIQAVARAQFEDVQWINFGDVPTFVSTTSFTVPGNQTARYHVGRRLKLFGTTMGTFYGNVASSVFGAVTTITVTLDSGALTSNLSAVSAGAITATNSSLPPSTVVAAQVPFAAGGGVTSTNVQAAIAELDTKKAPIASPALTGTPTVPTATAGTNTTQIASTAYVMAQSALDVASAVASAVASSSLVHIAGTETITGAKTFTGSRPVFQGASDTAIIKLERTGTSAGFGFIGADVGSCFIVYDSGIVARFNVTPAGAGTFSSTVSAANATASNHLVTKGQLDGKAFGGSVDVGGTMFGPAGWSAVRNSTGVFTVTHNLGTGNYGFSVSTASSGRVDTNSRGVNTFSYNTRDNAGTLSDSSVYFTLVLF